ncbi:transporter substrate-binding domain-containing protein [Bizionia sediminis]|uniref:Transporter substrate-binding domain-containing protein n=1 Tax=Bizionia sediminis TaxID=1737064 RepID=A0ABW5KQY4_9FLAO
MHICLNSSKKNTKSFKVLLGFVLLFSGNIWLYAQQANTNNGPATLRVGVAGIEPFVYSNSVSGIAEDIWNAIAENKSWNYKYIDYPNINAALEALQQGELDVVAGPISITSKRLEHMQFSQPFFNSSISIISRTDNLSFWEKIRPFFKVKFFVAIGVFLIILAIVGTLFWLAERHKSPDQFSKNPIQGIGAGMWLAVVTMSTTGYGDKAPITLLGRIIAGSWMVISIIFATSMVAGIASTLTLATISSATVANIEELSGARAATIAHSPSEDFLLKENVQVVGVDNLSEAIQKLLNKDVQAVVYDRPLLLYYIKNNRHDNLYISKAEYYKQGYGFAFPLQSSLVLDVNRELLKLAENQEITEIIHRYIEKDE